MKLRIVAIVSLTLLLLLSVGAVSIPTAEAATNRCPWPWQAKSCSTYASKQETRHMYAVSRTAFQYDLCTIVFEDTDDGGAQGFCEQLRITRQDREKFDKALQVAYEADGCLEFYRPSLSRTAGLVASKAKVHTGDYCEET